MCELGIKSGRISRWTDEEIEYVNKNYVSMPLEEIEKKLQYRHSIDAIKTKANKYLGFVSDKYWTDEENSILIKNYSNLPVDDVCLLLPNRTREAIINHATVLGIKGFITTNFRWNEEEDKYLIENWNDKSDNEIALALNKTRQCVKSRRCKLGLFRCRKDYRNYESFDKFLRGQIWDWKKESMIQCDYRCVISGEKDFQIHHLYPFSRILLLRIKPGAT